MWTILKVFIKFVTTLLLCYVLVFGHKLCGILAPQMGIEPAPSALEAKVFFKFNYLLIFGCARSLLLWGLFSSRSE